MIPFNRIAFNRPPTIGVILSTSVETATGAFSRINIDMPVPIAFNSTAELQSRVVLEIPQTMFNRTPFNWSTTTAETYLTTTIETDTDVFSRMNIDMPVSFAIDSTTDIHARMVREIPHKTEIQTATEMRGNLVRQIMFAPNMESATALLTKMLREMPYTSDIQMATQILSNMMRDMPYSTRIESTTDLLTTMIRIMPYRSEIQTATEMLPRMTRERLISLAIDTAAEWVAAITYSRIGKIRFLGDFRPGDYLVIDSDKMMVTLNGRNVTHLMDGELFDFVHGVNKLTYTDQGSARNIWTRITHKDKHYY